MERYKHEWRFPILLEVGKSLEKFVDQDEDGTIVSFIRNLRTQLSHKHRKTFPPVKIKDSSKLLENEYRISVNGNERFRGVLKKSTKPLKNKLENIFSEEQLPN